MKSPSTLIRNGFTLIEILVVAAIFIILATLGLFMSMDFYRGYAFRGERTILVSIYEKARARAISNINEAKHGVYAEDGQYVIFQGDTFDPSDPLNEPVDSNPSVEVTGSVWPLEIVFDQLTGDATAGSITLSQGTKTATISISSDGQINW